MKNQSSKRYAVKDLQVGMYVSSLDCPVSRTPYPLEGFYIRSVEDLHTLSHYCKHVLINTQKSDFLHNFNSALQLEVQDIPKVFSSGKPLKQAISSHPQRQVPKKRKNRPLRLSILLGACWLLYTGVTQAGFI